VQHLNFKYLKEFSIDMGQANKQALYIEKFGENLATFAINRDDLKDMINGIPKGYALNLNAIEYELQILKIISVGWAISFYMAHSDINKKPLSELYWIHIREISKNISNLTEASTGKTVNYFEILKERLDSYVEILQEASNKTSETSTIIGATFSEFCKAGNDPVAVLTGTKMFTYTIGSVKEYLNSVEIKKKEDSQNEN
jgi:hypothetical protein